MAYGRSWRRRHELFVRIASVDHIVSADSTKKAYCVEIPNEEFGWPGEGRRRVFIPKALTLISDDIQSARHPRCLWVRIWFAQKKGLRELPNPIENDDEENFAMDHIEQNRLIEKTQQPDVQEILTPRERHFVAFLADQKSGYQLSLRQRDRLLGIRQKLEGAGGDHA